MKILAPGKLILSGEHAVVYGKPALAMAVNRYVAVTASPQLSSHVSFDLADLKYHHKLSLPALEQLKNRIKQKYQRFVKGDFKIRDVLQKPVELTQFAFSLFFEILNVKLTQGISIHVQSNIPMGCGMGSSAATIVSIIHAVATYLHMSFSSEMLFRVGLEAENVQHGYSSGLDLRVSLHGGCFYMNEGQMYQRAIPQLPMFLVNTGVPEVSTGECVAAVASYFKSSSIGDDFAAVTNAMDSALQNLRIADVVETIRANHSLLTRIGVVPQEVQHFIAEVQKLGGGAKVCGAGTVAGSKAGMVLVVTENESTLITLCERYKYTILRVTGELRGVHVV